MKRSHLVVLAIAMLTLAQPLRAAPIAYEGFDYPIGSTLSNLSGGTGWLAPWTGANYGGGPSSSQQEFFVTNGLNWANSTGGYITGTGGAIFDHDGSAHGSYRQWFTASANDSDFTNTYGTTIWFSYIATYDTASGSGCSVNPFEWKADLINGFGVSAVGPAGGGDFQVRLRVGQFGEAPDPAALAVYGIQGSSQRILAACQPGTNLVVGRFRLGGGPGGVAPPFTGEDRLDVWLNPNADPGTNSGPLWLSGFYAYRSSIYSDGQLGIRTGGGGQMTIDELKIGTNYSDVVPATANSPSQVPEPPQLTIESAGPVGAQFNLAEATPTNSNEIATYYTTNSGGGSVAIDASWVGKTPASYSFTIAKPPAHGPTNFMAYAWLIPHPNGHIQALDNINAVQLALVSDGAGNARAVLGYYVNSSGTVQDNFQTLFNSGVICSIASAPFAGTWTINVTSDTGFTIVAPNGATASGSMLSGDEGNFGSSVSFYLGVSPNGASNAGNPALGTYMTVSGITITNSSGVTINPAWAPGVVVQSDFSNGKRFSAINPANWQVLATIPTCIYVMPANSVYRATWGNACGTSAGANTLTTSTNVTATSPWPTAVPTTALLSDGTNVAFITTSYTASGAGYFRVRVPYIP